MWRLQGYLSYHEIQQELRLLFRSDEFHNKRREVYNNLDKSQDFLLSSKKETPEYITKEVRSLDQREHYLRNEYCIRLIRENCLREFYSSHDFLHATSTTGLCLTMNPTFFVHRRIPGEGFVQPFIDPRLGVFSSEYFDKCYNAVKPCIDEMRSNIDDVDQDLAVYLEYVELCKLERDCELLSVIAGFDGWAVCCNEIYSPSNPSIFMSLDLTFNASLDFEKSISLKSDIIEAYDLGLIDSKDRLWREEFPHESREAFRAAWAEAALERPQLSKTGPKTS